jgi:glutamate-1-semialdehyde 2,1-aminomutase
MSAGWLAILLYEFDEAQFFRRQRADVASRRAGLYGRLSLSGALRQDAPADPDVKESLSDLQFTSTYRVPFQFSRVVREHLSAGSFWQSSAGVTLTDLDGNTFYDLTGSYGVNLFGYDFYKACMEKGAERVRDLGPVLGAYHPVLAYNVGRPTDPGLDEVSFHMSGTEAVCSGALGPHHTSARIWCGFAGPITVGGEMQPVGNPCRARNLHAEGDVGGTPGCVARRDIACVLVILCNEPDASALADRRGGQLAQRCIRSPSPFPSGSGIACVRGALRSFSTRCSSASAGSGGAQDFRRAPTSLHMARPAAVSRSGGSRPQPPHEALSG